MKIYFKSTKLCDYYYFFPTHDLPIVCLPENIELNDFLSLIQSSLDQIKPVILFSSLLPENEIDLATLKSFHQKIEPNKFIFLNYSIRNSLSRLHQKSKQVKSFNDIEKIFEQSIQ